jgi:single-stranded-DNA-specific exonuclease
MLLKINEAIEKLGEISRGKKLRVISHFDTDGVCSAAIFSRALSRWGKEFRLEIVKGLDEKFVRGLDGDEVLIFLDLGSGSFEYFKEMKNKIFVFDHHEIVSDVPENVFVVNPVLHQGMEPLSGAAVCYLFARALSSENKDLATLGVVGMVGDLHEKNIGKVFDEILKDSETTLKKGILIYPSTRPLDKALEWSSSPYIPGVTGNRAGVLELLRDSSINFTGGRYKSLYELTDGEMTKLITSVMIRCANGSKTEEMIGNLFLIKFFNKLEDARELSALINACSRMGHPEVSLGFCLGNKSFKELAEKIYVEYKQSLVSALRYVDNLDKIKGKSYTIINGQDKIKDTIIGTVASIISHSPSFPQGNIVIALAYNKDKIKVSARIAGCEGRNVREFLSKVVVPLGGEVGGHPMAAGCLISREKEQEFISEVQKVLDVELVKV